MRVHAVVFVRGYKCGFVCMFSVSVCMFYRCPTDRLLSGPAYPLLKVTLPYWLSVLFVRHSWTHYRVGIKMNWKGPRQYPNTAHY